MIFCQPDLVHHSKHNHTAIPACASRYYRKGCINAVAAGRVCCMYRIMHSSSVAGNASIHKEIQPDTDSNMYDLQALTNARSPTQVGTCPAQTSQNTQRSPETCMTGSWTVTPRDQNASHVSTKTSQRLTCAVGCRCCFANSAASHPLKLKSEPWGAPPAGIGRFVPEDHSGNCCCC